MKVLLLRHGKTKGNEEHRYIGRTEEGLSELGKKELLRKKEHWEKKKDGIRQTGETMLHKGDIVFVSPMGRCIETAEILFPSATMYKEERLKEIDFGLFENKNYQELNGQKEYQAWIDSGGRLDFPEGEPFAKFIQRSVAGFFSCVEIAKKRNLEIAVFVVHGGTIMSVMSELACPKKDYYNWQVKNGSGYFCNMENGHLEVIREECIH